MCPLSDTLWNPFPLSSCGVTTVPAGRILLPKLREGHVTGALTAHPRRAICAPLDPRVLFIASPPAHSDSCTLVCPLMTPGSSDQAFYPRRQDQCTYTMRLYALSWAHTRGQVAVCPGTPVQASHNTPTAVLLWPSRKPTQRSPRDEPTHAMEFESRRRDDSGNRRLLSPRPSRSIFREMQFHVVEPTYASSRSPSVLVVVEMHIYAHPFRRCRPAPYLAFRFATVAAGIKLA
ncbi:hypothetical protein C8Q77DRAFT_263361 [Trametes polyzona]|nr:hypothetical protein C8Q77DRAFT_263361 [Trametes polyzona]